MNLSDVVPLGQPEQPNIVALPSTERKEQPISLLARIITQASRFSGDAHGLDNGERAALSRLDPDGELRPHQIAALSRALIYADLEPDTWKSETWQRWMLIAHGMALAGRDASQSLGQQLSKTNHRQLRCDSRLSGTFHDDWIVSQCA